MDKNKINLISSLLLLSALFILLISSSANAFQWVGQVKNGFNGTNVQNATINVSLISFGPQGEQTLNSWQTYSNFTGHFVLNITNESQTDMFKATIILYDPSAAGNAFLVGPILPTFPKFVFTPTCGGPGNAFCFGGELNNSVLYLQNASTIYITAYNLSQNITFQGLLFDKKLGFPVEMFFQANITNKTLYVPATRNYTLVIMNPEGRIPPRSFDITLANISAVQGSRMVRHENLSTVLVNLYGQLLVTGNTSKPDYKQIVKYIAVAGMIPTFARMPSFPTDVLNSTGFYNISLLGPNIDFLIVTYANDSAYYAGFQNISLSADRNMDLTLKPLAGSYNELVYDAQVERTNTSKTTFILMQNATTDAGQAMIDAQVTFETPAGNTTVRWIINSNNSGVFHLSIWNTTKVKLKIFGQKYAPREVTFPASTLISTPTIMINLTSFDMRSPDGRDIGENISLDFFKSNSTCDVYSSTSVIRSQCSLSNFSNSEQFSPLKAMMGGAVSLRITHVTTGVMIHYTNVDLIASGPPDAQSDESATTLAQNGSSSFQQLWRFGSMGPSVYDRVLIGIPYNDAQLDESRIVRMNIPLLYDSDWHVVWNISLNTTAQLPEEYTDYNTATYNAFLNRTNPMECSRTNTSAMCYLNTTSNVLWLTIPHFSGVGPQIISNAAGLNMSSDNTVYSCFPSCVAFVNITHNNSASYNGMHNFTIINTVNFTTSAVTFTMDYLNLSSGTFVPLTSINQSNITLYNFTTPLLYVRLTINMSVPTSGKWSFNLSVDNSTPLELDPYIDAINLTAPATGSNISSSSSTNFNFTLFSNYNWSSQNCTLRINNTVNSSVIASNGAETGIAVPSGLSVGQHTWNISCNASGYSTVRYFSVAGVPTLTVTYPSNGFQSNNNATQINFSIVDTSGIADASIFASVNTVRYTITGVPNVTCSGSAEYKNCSLTPNSTIEGAVNITVGASNNNTFATNASVNITVDIQGPSLVFNNIWSGENTTSYNINFSVYDSRTGINLSSINVTTHSGFASGNCTSGGLNYTCLFAANLSAGNNTINITFRDNATNSNYSAIQITFDATAPTLALTIASANSSTITSPVNISWSATDAVGVQTVWYILDNLTTKNTVDNSVGYILINLTTGLHTILFQANDTAGNIASASNGTMTYFINALINITDAASGIQTASGASTLTAVNISLSNGTAFSNSTTYLNTTIDLNLVANVSFYNVPIVIDNFYGLAANWNQTSAFKVNATLTSTLNNTVVALGDVPIANLSITITNISAFLSQGTYNATVLFNNSQLPRYDNIYFCDDSSTCLRTLQCTGNVSSGFNGTACYVSNYALNLTTVIVPHFSSVVLTLDSIVGNLTLTSPDNSTSGAGIKLNFTVNDNITSATVMLNGAAQNITPYATYTAFAGNVNTSFSIPLNGTLPNMIFKKGVVQNISINLTDRIGNNATVNWTFNVTDSTAPNLTTISPASGNTYSDTGSTYSLTITATSSEYANVTYSLNGASFTSLFNENLSKSFTVSLVPGQNNVSFNLTDENGNYGFHNVTYNYTQTTTTTTVTTGGGGVMPPGKHSQGWAALSAGSKAIVTVTKTDIGFTSIEISIKNTITNAQITIERLTSKPTETAEIKEKVYQYIKVEMLNMPDAALEKKVIKFKVPKSWLTSNNAKPEEMVLKRYTTKWEELPTTQTTSDPEYYYYEAETPGFSYFVIAQKELVSAPAPSGVTGPAAPSPAPSAAPAPAAAPAPEAAPTPTAPAPAKANYLWIVLLIILIAAIAVIIYLMSQKKR